MKDTHVSDIWLALLAGVIVTGCFGGFMAYSAVQEVAYVSAAALKPLKPHFVKTMIVYRPLTPNERVQYGHHDLVAPKPTKLWASGNMQG